MGLTIENVLEEVRERDAEQTEFIQAVEEVANSLKPVFDKEPELVEVFRVLCEPERIVQFRVSWQNDKGEMKMNRGWRVQFNQALGPYKGGLRFRGGLQLSTLKFLGFEQVFKNALTTLPLGGAKGGSDFDPKGKSDGEVLRFCQAFMTELVRYIGPHTDVPAGDIGVGPREIGFLFGQYKRMVSRHDGVLTGKGITFGGSHIRPEATGYGLVYFTEKLVKDRLEGTLEGKKVLISGSGNVAQYAAQKVIELGGKVVSMSDSSGTIHEPEGISRDQLQWIMDLKNNKRGRIEKYTEHSDSAEYKKGETPWKIKADIALPCATQNEIKLEDAKALVENGVQVVCEGANMPTANDAIEHLVKNKVLFGPAKACNAGGVAVSGLEMSQNAQDLTWSGDEVDKRLKDIMLGIYDDISNTAKELGEEHNLQMGANAHGFKKVATAMLAQGMVFVNKEESA